MVHQMPDRRGGLAHGHGDLFHNVPLLQDGIRDALGEGFDQIEHGLAGQFLRQITDLAIMDRLFHQVGRSGGLPKAAVDVDEEFLPEGFLRLVDAVEAVEAEIGNEDTVGHLALLMA